MGWVGWDEISQNGVFQMISGDFVLDFWGKGFPFE